MRTCIVGGGLCGLTVAYLLSKTMDTVLMEKETFLGGCLSSHLLDDYQVERFYHHFFAGDRFLVDLAGELGLARHLEWLKGTTGYLAGGEIFPLNTPVEILRYPHLTLADKARLALFTLRSRRLDAASLDGLPARELVSKECGERVYNSFFGPLLRSKFGDHADLVSAAWLASRVAIRSNRGLEGERLGYIKGGFGKLIGCLSGAAEKRGCQIRTGAPVRRIRRTNGGWEVDGEYFDRVVSTIAPPALERVAGLGLPRIPYQGAACLTLGLSREVSRGIYWLNMKDEAPYGAVITHTNMVPFDRYGEHIVYLASYFTGRVRQEREESMLRDFMKRFAVREEEIRWRRMATEPCAGPIYVTGYLNTIPKYRERGLYLAGMFSRPNYPERSMEGSVRAALEVADMLTAEAEA